MRRTRERLPVGDPLSAVDQGLTVGVGGQVVEDAVDVCAHESLLLIHNVSSRQTVDGS